MPGNDRHESQDLSDYEVLDASDTLDGNPGDDPLDRGLATPDHWSAGLRYAAEGDEESESLDEQLAEEEPDITASDEDEFWDENETGQEASRDKQGEDADPRTGRLVSEDEDVDSGGDWLPGTSASTAAPRARRKPPSISPATPGSMMSMSDASPPGRRCHAGRRRPRSSMTGRYSSR
jgi:hypothetical protein